MQNLQESIKKLASDFTKLKGSLDLDKKADRFMKLEGETTDPDFWKDQERARMVMQEFGDLKKEIEEIRNLSKDLATLSELAEEGQLSSELKKEINRIKKAFQKIEVASFLSGRYDRRNAILSIHAGQGGVEAMDWTNMLYRMYSRYFDRRKWAYKVMDMTSGEEAGIKSVVIKVQGLFAYGYLKKEAGAHRLVRQSPFNADKLRQTSFALVEVLPEFEESDEGDIEIKEDDLVWQFYRSSGHGGQNVNKVSTAVRLTHKPSGITVTSQAERHQEKNRKNALNLLKAKLWLKKQAEEKSEIDSLKGDYRPASWGTQIRSYVLHPYKMVKDLRTKAETSNPESVLDGNLDQFIEAELRMTDN